MRHISLAFIIFLLLSVFLFPFSVSAQNENMVSSKYEDSAEAIYLYSYDAKSVLYSVGEEKILKPASTVKIMTGLIACEMLESRLNEKVLITEEMLKGHSGTTMGLKKGMTVSVEDLLYGAICGSNNDAAQVLAFVCSGSVENFVLEMNERAKRFNMQSTVYSNPTGLDTSLAHTTISDVALLSQKAVKNELYMQISSAKNRTVLLGDKKTIIYNRNALISHFTSNKYLNENVSGLNAGSTDAGGYVISTIINVNDCRYLCIVLGAEAYNGEIYSYKIVNDFTNTLNQKYSNIKLFSKGESFSEIDVELALDTKNKMKIDCILQDDIFAYLPKDINLNEELKYKVFLHNDIIEAPIEEGTVLGGVNIYYKGQVIASGNLVSDSSMSSNSFLVFMNSMKKFLLSRFFLIFFALFIIGIIVFLCFDRKYQRRKKVGYIQYKKFF